MSGTESRSPLELFPMTDTRSRAFFTRNACTVARDLLGQTLVHRWSGHRLAGKIVETEAYCATAVPDLACHASKNNGQPTPRTAVMFGPPGHAYVYLSYGIHWLFNIVTHPAGTAGAVLIRALEPLEGEAFMAHQRAPRARSQWTNGPGKLTQALALDQTHNGLDLCQANSAVWVEAAASVPDTAVSIGPRIGLGKTPEPWLSRPWRYWIDNNPFVSR